MQSWRAPTASSGSPSAQPSGAGDRIGSIDPGTRRITETAIPTAGAQPESIAVGSDGNVWFAEMDRPDVGVLSPTPLPIFTAPPPAHIAAGGAFGLTITVIDASGRTDAQYNGDVGLEIVSPFGDRFAGAAADGTVRAVAHNGVATFSGLVIDGLSIAHNIQLGAFTALPAKTTTYAPATVALPTIVAQQSVLAIIDRTRRFVSFWLEFDTAMDPAAASDPANYSLVQFRRHGRRLVARPVAFRVAYVAATQRATLTLVGRPKFAQGGELVVHAAPPGGLVDAAGLPLDGGGQGVPGDDGTFVIARKGKGISR